MLDSIQNIDFYILDFLQTMARSSFWDKFFSFFTVFGNAPMFICYTALFLVFRQTRKEGLMLTGGLTTGLVIGNLILKNVIRRARPCWLRPEITLLVKNPSDYSFPSGHAIAATVFAVILIYTHPKLAYGLIPAALLMCYSRMYLYVHFPSDVLAGMLIGAGIGVLTCYLTPKIEKKINERKEKRSII